MKGRDDIRGNLGWGLRAPSEGQTIATDFLQLNQQTRCSMKGRDDFKRKFGWGLRAPSFCLHSPQREEARRGRGFATRRANTKT